jgi:hypothetical protein
MKLAAVYNVFDGEELLPYSYRSISNCVDEIIIVFQEISNYGHEHEDKHKLNLIIKKIPNAHLIKFSPKSHDPMSAEGRERQKRALGAKKALEIGCTHCIFMDCDEFYIEKDFLKAKRDIQSGGYNNSACQLVTYYKKPTYRLTPNENYYVPFIFKLEAGKTSFSNFSDFPVHCDPSRKAAPYDRMKLFKREQLEMHHMTMVRRNIDAKFTNHSLLGRLNIDLGNVKEEYNDLEKNNFAKVSYPFENYGIAHVDNIFSVPDFSVDILNDSDFSLIKKIEKEFQNNFIDGWLSSGTYLSLYRENRLFPWDIDIDYDLLNESKNVEMAIQCLNKIGFTEFSKPSKKQILFKHKKSNRILDLYLWDKTETEYVSKCDVGVLFYPNEIIDNKIQVAIVGTNFLVPEPDGYFKCRYGEDWIYPKRASGLPGGGWEITKNIK